MSGFYVSGEIILQLIRDFQRDIPRNLQHSIPLECYKEEFECSFPIIDTFIYFIQGDPFSGYKN